MIVYTHTRNDTGEIFYVGAATYYCRAKSASHRSRLWYNITCETTFTVNVVAEDLTPIQAYKKERELIKKYKRMRDGGTLANVRHDDIKVLQRAAKKDRMGDSISRGLRYKFTTCVVKSSNFGKDKLTYVNPERYLPLSRIIK